MLAKSAKANVCVSEQLRCELLTLWKLYVLLNWSAFMAIIGSGAFLFALANKSACDPMRVNYMYYRTG